MKTHTLPSLPNKSLWRGLSSTAVDLPISWLAATDEVKVRQGSQMQQIRKSALHGIQINNHYFICELPTPEISYVFLFNTVTRQRHTIVQYASQNQNPYNLLHALKCCSVEEMSLIRNCQVYSSCFRFLLMWILCKLQI